ncbi:metal-dependent hydrolase [Nanoarchaeota archaeon]
MANPVTHVLVPMLIMETYRRYFAKKKFSRWYVFLAGFFGGAPDFDLIYSWFVTGSFDMMYHRNVTHTLLIPIITLFLGLTIYMLYSRKALRHKGWKVSYLVLFMMTIGTTFHVLIDGIDGLVYWFYPFHFKLTLPGLIVNKYRAAFIDGILLFAWILYDEEFFNDILRVLRKIKRKIT